MPHESGIDEIFVIFKMKLLGKLKKRIKVIRISVDSARRILCALQPKHGSGALFYVCLFSKEQGKPP